MMHSTAGRLDIASVNRTADLACEVSSSIEIGMDLVGQAGLATTQRTFGGEALSAVVGFLSPGDTLSISLTRPGAESSLALRVAARLGASTARQRERIVLKALEEALIGAFPSAVFRDAKLKSSDSGSYPALAHRIEIAPASRRLSKWQARAMRDAPPAIAASNGSVRADAGGGERDKAEIGARLSLGAGALAMALRCIDTPVALDLDLGHAALGAADLRKLGQIEKQLVADILSPDDPLVDVMATNELTRVRILTRECTALRLSVMVRSARPLEASERDLLSSAIFDAPAATGDDIADDKLSALLPRAVGGQAAGSILSTMLRVVADGEARCNRVVAGGTLMGNTLRGTPERQSYADRSQHTYALGATGTGKSTMLLNLLVQDIEAGEGVILIDPHGDLYHAVASLVPERRRADLILADAGSLSESFTLNVLQGNSGDPGFDRNTVANDLIELFRRVLYRGVPEAFGPMFEVYFRNALLLLMASRGSEATVLDFERLFQDDSFRRKLVKDCPLDHVADFWSKTAERVSNHEISIESIAPYIVCKLNQITSNERLRPILGATSSTVDFDAIINGRKICLVNLDKARLGEKSAAFLGGVMLSRLCMAALSQGRKLPGERTPATIVLDEFHTYATDSLPVMLAETRKYGFRITLANQSVSQIDGRGLNPNVLGPILGNVANLVTFRVGVEDAAAVAGWLAPEITPQELTRLPNFHAVARLIANGEPRRPVHLEMPPPPSA